MILVLETACSSRKTFPRPPMAIPMMAFWTVAGLRAAFRSPVAEKARWVFRVIHGRPQVDHMCAAEFWVAIFISAVTIATAIALHVFAPAGSREYDFLFQEDSGDGLTSRRNEASRTAFFTCFLPKT